MEGRVTTYRASRMNRKIKVLLVVMIILAVVAAYIVLQGKYFATVHDVAVVRVTVSSTQLYQGDAFNITVTAKNEGTTPEEFNITSFWNATRIDTKKVTNLAPNAETALVFNWSTQEALPGNYIIKAEANTVTGEANTTDNISVFGVVRVRQRSGLEATMFVDPRNSTVAVGQDFSVRINVTGVTDLFGWEFKLSWNATILEVVGVTEGTFLKNSGSTVFYPTTNNTTGRLTVDCTLLGDRPGVGGNGTLATIQFHAKESGLGDLGIYDATLLSSFEEEIAHAVVDGHFAVQTST